MGKAGTSPGQREAALGCTRPTLLQSWVRGEALAWQSPSATARTRGPDLGSLSRAAADSARLPSHLSFRDRGPLLGYLTLPCVPRRRRRSSRALSRAWRSPPAPTGTPHLPQPGCPVYRAPCLRQLAAGAQAWAGESPSTGAAHRIPLMAARWEAQMPEPVPTPCSANPRGDSTRTPLLAWPHHTQLGSEAPRQVPLDRFQQPRLQNVVNGCWLSSFPLFLEFVPKT